MTGEAVEVAGAVSVGLSGSLQPDDTVLGGSLTLSVVALMVAGAVGAVTTVIAVPLLPSLTLVTVYMALALTGAGPAPGGRTVRAPVPPPPPRRARCFRGRTAG
jgi:hypothetical protein